MWRVVWGRVPIKVELLKRGVSIIENSLCPLSFPLIPLDFLEALMGMIQLKNMSWLSLIPFVIIWVRLATWVKAKSPGCDIPLDCLISDPSLALNLCKNPKGAPISGRLISRFGLVLRLIPCLCNAEADKLAKMGIGREVALCKALADELLYFALT
ncbi:hypothetical protein V6N11_049016 [Hibiscus sabdariffa]|uniref:RNase H type-1 domain-containing protein n=1 Tax=Hibiscus sabdariffa TaxID=183260 RepID=A0ABR2PXK0_9ROSI